MYQDQWVRGRVVKRGQRECAERYTIVKTFCERFAGQPFAVCDLGANACYFGLRLLEDFPACRVMAFEFGNFEERAKLVRRNRATRLMLLQRKVSMPDLDVLASCTRFDVVLALSVLHHVGGEFADWIDALRRLGRFVVLELAGEDSRSRRMPTGHGVPPDAIPLGFATSHIRRDMQRPMVALPGLKR